MTPRSTVFHPFVSKKQHLAKQRLLDRVLLDVNLPESERVLDLTGPGDLLAAYARGESRLMCSDVYQKPTRVSRHCSSESERLIPVHRDGSETFSVILTGYLPN